MSANSFDPAPRRDDRIDPSGEQGVSQNRLAMLMRSLRGATARRDLLRGLAATGFGLGLAAVPLFGEAKPKRRKKRKRPKPAKPNQYGCLEVNDPCRRHTQCCSGICTGKPGRKRCRAHNQGICTSDFDLCTTGVDHHCSISNPSCRCLLTTGDAGFCGDLTAGLLALCQRCSRDADCVPVAGPGAACVAYGGICGGLCPGTGGTACVPACPGT